MKINYVGFYYILVGEVPLKSNYDLNVFVENSSVGFGFLAAKVFKSSYPILITKKAHINTY